MTKSFIDVVQDITRVGLGIPVKTKTLSSRPYCRSRNSLSALNFTSGWSQPSDQAMVASIGDSSQKNFDPGLSLRQMAPKYFLLNLTPLTTAP